MSDTGGINNLYWLNEADEQAPFPPVQFALREPNGLLSFGGDLSTTRLLRAYRAGIFPWYSKGQPIMWWSPDPRAVLFPEDLKISRSLRKAIQKQPYRITLNQDFTAVMTACAEPRAEGAGTWITEEMKQAYCQLHRAGHAVSVEAWHAGRLVGGLYGIAMGRVFFGESMFSRLPNASKIAFVQFARQLQGWGFRLIDCQVQSAHLRSLGAIDIPRYQFVDYLEQWCDSAVDDHRWQFDTTLDAIKE